MNKWAIAKVLLKYRCAGILIGEVLRRLYSNGITYVVRKDRSIPVKEPGVKISVAFREGSEEEIAKILDLEGPGMSKKDKWNVIRRSFLACSGIRTCYIGITEDDIPCHIDWFIGPSEDGKIHEFFDGGFPPLADDEMLLEGGYTPETYRRKGIMANAYWQIPKIGSPVVTRWVLSYMRKGNVESLKAARRAGFEPYLLREEKWRFFRRKFHYTVLPPGTPFYFDEQ
jgi:hypothetical protein